jgi:hypothetical protein
MRMTSTVRGYLVLAVLAVVVVIFVSALVKALWKPEPLAVVDLEPEQVEEVPSDQAEDDSKKPDKKPVVWEGAM